MPELYELLRRVKRGVALLNSRIPNWRDVLRKHQDEFDFSSGEHCVLGTLEHYSKRMRQLKARGAGRDERNAFALACRRLQIHRGDADEAHGFDAESVHEFERDDELTMLSDIWRAEFELPETKK